MAYDVQVIGQAIIYFAIFIFGFVIALPLGISVIQFDHHCILFAEVTWKNATYFTCELSDPGSCNFSSYGAVFTCIFYAFGMFAYHTYAALKSKDPNIGFQMWVMPFILVNSLICIYMFVSCCLVSIGISTVCDRLTEGQKMGSKIRKCSDAQKFNWNTKGTDYNAAHFYHYPKVTEAASWLTLLLWLTQVALCILRFVRNRRLRSKDMEPMPESTVAASSTPDDLENFASAHPTA